MDRLLCPRSLNYLPSVTICVRALYMCACKHKNKVVICVHAHLVLSVCVKHGGDSGAKLMVHTEC